VVRRGTEILRIEASLVEVADETFMRNVGVPSVDWDDVPCYKIIVFLTKFFQSPGGDRFDYLPRLIREPVLFRPAGTIRQGSGRVVLTSTPWDPLAEVPVGETVSLSHGAWHNTMLPGKVVARMWNPLRLARHAFFKADGAAYLLEQYEPSASARAKEVLEAARRY
jgi:hypothetical protein